MTHEGAHNRMPHATGEGARADESLAVQEGGASPLSAGTTFARYEIVRCIGAGGMGAVFEATHTLLKKRVALKALHANLSRSESGRERFLREAETVARIRHPNVVDITDVGVEGGVPYFVMEFLEGEDVASLLDRGRLAPAVAADIVVPIASGLCAVHRLGIVHRDIKPENVFLARDNHGEVVPKLVDFGVSKDLGALGSGAPPLHTVTGTPHYMSPEQARGAAALDGRTDQYALGVMLYQCLSGVRPYDAESLLELMHLIDSGEFTPLRTHVPQLPEELEAIVHRAMARHPRDRFESMNAFGRALLPFASPRTRYTHERDFADNIVLQTSLSQKDAALHAHLSANTLPLEAFEQGSEVAPSQTTSGVRVRHELAQATSREDTSPTVPEVRHERRFWLWFGLSALALVAFGGFLLWGGGGAEPGAEVREPGPPSPAPEAAKPQGAEPPRGAAVETPPREPVRESMPEVQQVPPSPAAVVPAADGPARAGLRSTSRRKRPAPPRPAAESPAKPTPTPPTDIQLSR